MFGDRRENGFITTAVQEYNLLNWQKNAQNRTPLAPKSKEEMQSSLDIAGYLDNFIDNYATLAAKKRDNDPLGPAGR